MMNTKPSGVQWIGDIPKDWNIIKIKNLKNKEENSFIDGDWIESPFITESGIRYYTTGNIGDGFFKDQGNGHISESTFQELKCKYAYGGDLVFSRLNAPYGRSCILPSIPDKCVLAVDNVILRTDEDKRYICYVTQCIGYQDSVFDKAAGTTMKRISRTNLGNIVIPLPPISEQQAIASYLDDRCSKLDVIIAEAEKSIEDYKELKQAVIFEAVTKGLDKKSSLNYSLDWCDTGICSAWDISQIRYLYTLRNERNYKPLEEVNLISLYTDKGVVQHADLEKTTGNKAVTADGYKIVYPDDVIVNIILCWMGAIGRCEYEGVTSPAYDIYKPIDVKRVCSRYYHYLFRTQNFAGKCYTLGRGIMMMRWRTYSSEFKSIKVPVPPYLEQIAIADYLDKRIGEMDALISEKQSLIEDLQAYKKSLIYEVVTGKRRVV